MRLFGKKKPKAEESTYEIFGGFTINKTSEGYEIEWRSPNVTSIHISSPPMIDDNVQVKFEGDTIYVTSQECKLKIVTEEGKMTAYISKI